MRFCVCLAQCHGGLVYLNGILESCRACYRLAVCIYLSDVQRLRSARCDRHEHFCFCLRAACQVECHDVLGHIAGKLSVCRIGEDTGIEYFIAVLRLLVTSEQLLRDRQDAFLVESVRNRRKLILKVYGRGSICLCHGRLVAICKYRCVGHIACHDAGYKVHAICVTLTDVIRSADLHICKCNRSARCFLKYERHDLGNPLCACLIRIQCHIEGGIHGVDLLTGEGQLLRNRNRCLFASGHRILHNYRIRCAVCLHREGNRISDLIAVRSLHLDQLIGRACVQLRFDHVRLSICRPLIYCSSICINHSQHCAGKRCFRCGIELGDLCLCGCVLDKENAVLVNRYCSCHLAGAVDRKCRIRCQRIAIRCNGLAQRVLLTDCKVLYFVCLTLLGIPLIYNVSCLIQHLNVCAVQLFAGAKVYLRYLYRPRILYKKNAVLGIRSRLVFLQLTMLIQLKGRIRCDRVSIRRYCLAQDIGGVGLQLLYYLVFLRRIPFRDKLLALIGLLPDLNMRTRKLLVVGDVHLADLDGGGGVFDEKNAVFGRRSRLVFLSAYHAHPAQRSYPL